MDKRDKMVIVVGIIILVIALIGVMYEEEQYTEASEEEEKITYSVIWVDEEKNLVEDETVMKGETTALTFPVNEEGLIEVKFSLTWSDNLARGILIPWNWSDVIELKIDAPGSVEFSSNPVSGYKGELTITAKVSEKPDEMRINATNETELQDILSSFITTNGMGDWNAEISILPKPFVFDRGNDFTISVTYSYYSPTYTYIS